MTEAANQPKGRSLRAPRIDSTFSLQDVQWFLLILHHVILEGPSRDVQQVRVHRSKDGQVRWFQKSKSDIELHVYQSSAPRLEPADFGWAIGRGTAGRSSQGWYSFVGAGAGPLLVQHPWVPFSFCPIQDTQTSFTQMRALHGQTAFETSGWTPALTAGLQG